MQHTDGKVAPLQRESDAAQRHPDVCPDQTEWSACSALCFLRGIVLLRLMERRCCPAKRSKGGDRRGCGRGRQNRRGVGRLRRYGCGGGWLQLRRIGEVDASGRLSTVGCRQSTRPGEGLLSRDRIGRGCLRFGGVVVVVVAVVVGRSGLGTGSWVATP